MSDRAMRGLRDDEPLMQAWNAYKATDDFANTRKWAADLEWIATDPSHADWQLWGAFVAGWRAAGGKIDP